MAMQSDTPTATPTTRALAQITPPPSPTPTPTPQPLPPALIESDPFNNSEVALFGAITLYFNQPMHRETVEASFAGLEGTFTWIDDSTVIFTTLEVLEPSSSINVSLDTMIKATNGLSLLEIHHIRGPYVHPLAPASRGIDLQLQVVDGGIVVDSLDGWIFSTLLFIM